VCESGIGLFMFPKLNSLSVCIRYTSNMAAWFHAQFTYVILFHVYQDCIADRIHSCIVYYVTERIRY